MTDEEVASIGPEYALGRLERAIAALSGHDDPEVRKRAVGKVDKWMAVLNGMADGSLTVGSRTPVKDTPAWVTLEVAPGGFATGHYMAETPIDEEERQLLAQLSPQVPGHTERERLNLAFLSDGGQQALLDAMREGRYRIDVPEEGALPLVAWLIAHDFSELALDVIQELRPLMHRLRFYPRLQPRPGPAGATVRVATVAQVAEPLRDKKVNPRIRAMNEALSVWAPLYDDLVSLWLDTVQGEPPSLTKDGSVAGGWPGQRWPDNWQTRRKEWLTQYNRARLAHTYCTKHRHPKANFARLMSALEACEGDSAKLTARDVGWVRRALANTLSKRGAPGSSERTALRARQQEIATRPTYARLSHLLANRLTKFPPDGGLPSLSAVSGAVGADEATDIAAGTLIPSVLVKKTERALEAPIEELVERGIIGSSEVLAIVLPQITAQVAAAGIEDNHLRALFSKIYGAFRRRRSLLLLNLEHQVQLEELPWVAALSGIRSTSLATEKRARLTLEQVAELSLSAFPHTILPNPLIREMAALAAQAGLTTPMVEEVAADIFMGTFTQKWREAAIVASEVLEGSVYARYYDLPPHTAYSDKSAGFLSRMQQRWGKQTSDGFAELCEKRAREAGADKASSVAANGAVIEQSQILTTHNLAMLTKELRLSDKLGEWSPDLCGQVFRWIFQRHSQPVQRWRAQLQMVKNTAYAWRQALFFLSFCDDSARAKVLDELTALSAEATGSRARRLEPAVAGLRRIADGERFDESGRCGPGRRFLGWSVGRHWMLAEPPRDAE